MKSGLKRWAFLLDERNLETQASMQITVNNIVHLDVHKNRNSWVSVKPDTAVEAASHAQLIILLYSDASDAFDL